MNHALHQRLRSTFPELLADDTALLERFLRETVVRSLPPGQVVCQQGDSCGYLPLLLSGRARVFKSAESGREITLYRIDAGDSCVLTASCIMSDIPFPALAVSETEVEAVLIPAGSVRAWMGESAAWRRYLFGLVARRLADVIAVVEEVAFRRLDARVAAWLLEHAAGGVAHTTHQELAVDLGSSREVVSRILRDLENEGMIRRTRGEILLLDRVRLGRTATG
ncbi:Crp/Fnr family transcriptional regulator [Sulfurivermis fontis]|uniref:Crp/Fnr family transcriptional regulator n=1 Tax=Sulfurivermis fontis TaxID=1972068 RepID=UPI000FDBE4A9|nr:Crp/Fnr family transcriptional regulator [Sulfurivermis fontis]